MTIVCMDHGASGDKCQFRKDQSEVDCPYCTIDSLTKERDELLIDANVMSSEAIEFGDNFEVVLRERDRYRKALETLGDGDNWFHTTDEDGGPYTAWRGGVEPDDIANKALKDES